MARRRAHGEGTILQLANGKWRADVSLGYDADGKRKRKTVYGRTQKEVRQKLDELKRHLAQGTLTDTKLTVKEYLERWLKEKARQVKPRTAELYREQAERYVYRCIGGLQLSKLTPMHVQNMMSEIADTVGVPTANKCRLLVYSALKQAVRWQLIPRNPVDAVDKLKETQKEMVLWAPAEVVRFLEIAQGHRLHAAFYVLLSTGLRRGELLGLQWQDISGNVISIRRSLTILNNKPAFSTPKTARGVRRVAVSADVLEVLDEHYQRQLAEKELLGDAWTDSGQIFTGELGLPFSPHAFNKVWAKLCKAAGLKARLHDMRHLHVSLLVKKGFDPRTIADRVGHTSPAFTMSCYSHMFEEQRQDAAMSLGQLLSHKGEHRSIN